MIECKRPCNCTQFCTTMNQTLAEGPIGQLLAEIVFRELVSLRAQQARPTHTDNALEELLKLRSSLAYAGLDPDEIVKTGVVTLRSDSLRSCTVRTCG